MIKQLSLLKKNPNLTMDEFIDYYENYHSKINERIGSGETLIPRAQRYIRRYVIPERNPITGEVIEPDFDCIMELWWNDRDDFEDHLRRLAEPNVQSIIAEDERKLFASNSNPCFTVEEFETPITP